MPIAGNHQRPGRERRPQPPAEDRRHERIEDAQRRAREPRQRRQPEQLIGGELEADRGQLRDHHRPHHPDRERQQQAPGSRSRDCGGQWRAHACPRTPGLPAASRRCRCGPSLPACLGSWIDCISGSSGSLLQLRLRDSALHVADRDVHPDQRGRDQSEQQHEATGPDAGEVVERAERDRQHEAAEPADHADETADRADTVGVIDRDMLVDRGLAEAHEESQHEHDHDE